MNNNGDDDVQEFTSGQIIAFKIFGILQVFLFASLLALAIYNTFYFLYRQRRYRIYFITCFYGLAYLVIVIRLILAIIVTIVSFKHSPGDKVSDTVFLTFVALQIGAAYAKILLGFFQVVAIVILTLQVKQLYPEKMDKISFWLYLSVTVWNSCLVLSVIIFCCVLIHCLNEKDGDR